MQVSAQWGDSLDSFTENTSRQFESEEEMHASAQWGDIVGDLRTPHLPESNCGDCPEVREGSIVESSSLRQKGKFPEKEKKVQSKRKNEKMLKMISLGFANRLKIRHNHCSQILPPNMGQCFSGYERRAD